MTVSADPGEANVAPVATQVIPPQELTVGEAAVTLDLDDYFTDPNMDDLGYTAPSPDTSVVTTSVSGSQLTLTGVGVGTVVVEVTAEDPEGLQSLLGVTVTVRTPGTENRAPAQTARNPRTDGGGQPVRLDAGPDGLRDGPGQRRADLRRGLGGRHGGGGGGDRSAAI